ncbi:MAG TPA: penicillin-binding transpeptidase domain-containing protein [Acidimicrobiia bacterium]|nr:penicillin-binding transpeptidase domain-containing protein [Acidimicrobiia bacterium]
MKYSLRLATLGFSFLALFVILALRLWVVQVAEGATIAEEAEELTWHIRTYEAPRGDIFDRSGKLVVTSRYVPAVEVDRAFVSRSERANLVQGLSAVLGVPAAEIDAMYDEAGINGRFTVGTVSVETAFELATRLQDYPGVDIVKVPERVYLAGPDLAHVTGHLGLPTRDDLEETPDLDPTVRIGQLGVESVYDDRLRGDPGIAEYRVAGGEIVETRPQTPAEVGDSVYLTIDLGLQELVSRALVDGVELSNEVKADALAQGEEVFAETKRAAAVVLHAKTGEVLSLASYPTFDPQQFVSGLDQETFDDLRESRAFNNLAVSGLYPPASTFKAFTYAAAEQFQFPFPEDVEGVDGGNRTVHCDGTLELPTLADGSVQEKNDWYTGDKGWLDLHGALEQSCNIYFWSVALGVWQNRTTMDVNVLQDFVSQLGYGRPTGIDLTGEAAGIVPTPELFEEWKEYQLANPNSAPRLDPSRLELPGGPFLGGDLMDLAIGQGALTATPIQVAVSYAALVNGGDVMEPGVVTEIRDTAGETVYRHEPTTLRTVDIDPAVRQSLLADLGRVVSSGTARAAFVDFGEGVEEVGGKTGTGQTSQNRDNHAWFVGVAPIADPEFIVVVLIDEGGSGGQIAAPVARHILQYLMGNEPMPIVQGEDAD